MHAVSRHRLGGDGANSPGIKETSTPKCIYLIVSGECKARLRNSALLSTALRYHTLDIHSNFYDLKAFAMETRWIPIDALPFEEFESLIVVYTAGVLNYFKSRQFSFNFFLFS